jgi:phage N-6-adenine-methyltransferase
MKGIIIMTKLIQASALKQKTGINRNDWRTPQKFFKPINQVFDFQVDGATDGAVNSLLPEFHTVDTCYEKRKEDYRTKRVFINPPFNELSAGYWFQDVMKATRDSTSGLVAILVPMRPETKYWEELVWGYATIFVPNHRVNFVDPVTNKTKNGAAFASVVLFYGNLEGYELGKLNSMGVFIKKMEV